VRVAEGNRLRPGLPAAVREGVEGHVARLGGRVEAIDKGVAAAVRRAPAGRGKDRLLRSVRGVGPVVSRTLLADLQELGTRPPGPPGRPRSRPTAAGSGGGRHVRGGRREVRRTLYIAALAVARVPGPLRDFARRLKAKARRRRSC